MLGSTSPKQSIYWSSAFTLCRPWIGVNSTRHSEKLPFAKASSSTYCSIVKVAEIFKLSFLYTVWHSGAVRT